MLTSSMTARTAVEEVIMRSNDIGEVLVDLAPGGPIQPYISGFIEGLVDQGHTLLTSRDYARAAGHLGRWMDACDLELEHLQDCHVEDFSRHRCACSHAARKGRVPSKRYVRRVLRFVDYLRQLGVVAERPRSPKPKVPAILTGFRQWMLQHRGVTESTISRYERMVSRMLPELGNEPEHYDAALVRRVLLQAVRGRRPVYAKTFVTALRAFLRFLATEGRCRPHLDRAVPTIPEWTLASLPHHLNADDVERVIDSCDLEKPHGVRDRAVLLLLARLGLRAIDIVAMRLGDVDWTSGTLTVRGKNRREIVLPLPQEAGEALLRYVVDVRPETDIGRLFLCSNAPIRPFARSATVSSIVMLALRRAGITAPPSRGAHLLRHSAAVSMLRSGVSVDTISTVLRHQSADMTAYYAKVDVALLQKVAQPWPEGAPC
jgi:site-specific recombinase XerD